MLQSSQVAKGTLVFGEGLAADTDAIQQSIKENRPRDCVEEPGTVVCVSGQELTRRRPLPTKEGGSTNTRLPHNPNSVEAGG